MFYGDPLLDLGMFFLAFGGSALLVFGMFCLAHLINKMMGI